MKKQPADPSKVSIKYLIKEIFKIITWAGILETIGLVSLLIFAIKLFLKVNNDFLYYLSYNPQWNKLKILLMSILGALLLLIFIVKFIRKHKNATAVDKARWAFFILFCMNVSLFSIEYLIYLNYRDNFFSNDLDTSIERSNDVSKAIDEIDLKLHYNKNNILEYTQLLSKLDKDSSYHWIELNNRFYLKEIYPKVELHPVEYLNTSGESIKSINKSCRIKNSEVRGVGLYLENEKFNIASPSSALLAKKIRADIGIKGEDVIELVNKKIEFYDSDCRKYVEIIDNIKSRGISFYKFVFHNINCDGKLISQNNYIVKILMFFQIIITVFIWGYFTKQVYKIIDGD